MDVEEFYKHNFLFRITAPHFCAGIVIDRLSHKVVVAAPIVRYMIGWKVDIVKAYCGRKNWKCEIQDERIS